MTKFQQYSQSVLYALHPTLPKTAVRIYQELLPKCPDITEAVVYGELIEHAVYGRIERQLGVSAEYGERVHDVYVLSILGWLAGATPHIPMAPQEVERLKIFPPPDAF